MTGSGSLPTVRHDINRYSLYLFFLAIGEFVAQFLSTALFSLIGEHVTLRTRKHYLRAILSQNIAYFDHLGAGEVGTRISSDMNILQDGISEKVTFVVSAVSAFVCALCISFYKSWKLALICFSTVVAMVLAMGVFGKLTIPFKTKALQTQADASNVAEEAVSSIRTTTAFNAQTAMSNRYTSHLATAQKWGFRTRSTAGFMLGIITCVVYMEHALSFWQGSRFLVKGEITLSAVITIQLAIMMAGFNLAQALPHFSALPQAIAAARKVFDTIDRKSPVNPFAGTCRKLDTITGRLEFQNLKFFYPSRSEPVYEDLSFIIPEGKVTALVGPSGCGKSTIVSLIERFYLPVAGNILLDGVDTMEIDVRWLRQQIALVSQEPVLFSGTIYDNVEAGLIGTDHEQVGRNLDMVIPVLR
jgi:ATP-binding cassette, subfamily B (MDR/TAP), member 1